MLTGELTRTQIEQCNAWLEQHFEEMKRLWQELVEIESGNQNKAGVDKVCERLAGILRDTGAETEIIPMEKKGNLLSAVWGKDNPGRPILFCGHMDTVFADGTLAKNPFRIDEAGFAHGPGCLDMKAGLVIAVYTVKALADCGWKERPVRVVFTGDEENGHRNTNAADIVTEKCQGCAAAWNFETGYMDDGIVTGRKGHWGFTLEVTGVSSHAGNAPEKGISAIEEMAYKIIALQKLNDLPNGTSLNCGVISGGTVANAIPGSCRLEVDVRYSQMSRLTELRKRVEEIVHTSTVPGTSAVYTPSIPAVTMEESEPSRRLFRHYRETAKMTGYGDVHPIYVGGWSDANLIATQGVPVICGVGIKGEWNHTPREYAEVSSLLSRAKLTAASVLTLEDRDIFE